jgi:hypothetical protein
MIINQETTFENIFEILTFNYLLYLYLQINLI